jgi:hypothetical protein
MDLKSLMSVHRSLLFTRLTAVSSSMAMMVSRTLLMLPAAPRTSRMTWISRTLTTMTTLVTMARCCFPHVVVALSS